VPDEIVANLLVSTLLLYPVVTGMFFMTGGLIGKWIVRFRSRTPPTGLAERVAVKVVGRRNTSHKEKERAIQRMANIISAVAPVLTFIASIAGAWFAYLTALSKQAGK